MTPRHARPRHRSAERGDAMVGFVIGFPIAFALLAILVQMVLLAWADNAAQHAALAAVREARIEGGTDDAAADRAGDLLDQVGVLEDYDIAVDRGAGTVDVTVSGDVTSIVPFWQPTVSHTASGPIEEFVDGTQP